MEKEYNNICQKCKHYRSVQSSTIVFTEREDICFKLGIIWPCEEKCEYFEKDELKEDK